MTEAGNAKPRIGLVLGGYAPAMTLASGAMLGFREKGIEFDVISTSGPGALIALLALAPSDNNPKRALEELPNLYMSDLTYAMLRFNPRLGAKNSPLANPIYQLGKALPRFTIAPDDPAVMQRFFNDWVDWAVAALTPAFDWSPPGLLSHSRRFEEMIDFSNLCKASTRFYVSAFDLVEKKLNIFNNKTTNYEAFCASQSSSLFYPPHRLSGQHGGMFFSSLGHDANGLQAIWLYETDKLDMVLAFDPITDAVWREPTDIVDAFQLMLTNPIAALNISTLGLYCYLERALEHKKDPDDPRPRLPPLYRIAVSLGDYPRAEILKWTYSNAVALQKIGRRAATDFADVLLSGDNNALEQRRFCSKTPNDSGWGPTSLVEALVTELMNEQEMKTPRVVRRSAPDPDWWSQPSDVALLVGGGAPDGHLSAGALCAFYDNQISFDAISASGAGALPALLYAAPAKAGSQVCALQKTVNLNIADEIEHLMPLNFKVFFKSGPFAEPAWRLAQALPRFTMHAKERYTNDLKRLYNDTLDLLITMMTPTTLNLRSTGVCTRVGMLDKVIAWDRLASYPKQFYVNAFNLKTQRLETFSKDNLTEERLWAALAMPWLFAPAKMDGMIYTEGASHDPSGLGALLSTYNRSKTEYPGAEGFTLSPFNQLDTIIALETVGPDLWTKPETLLDAFQITIMEPIVSLAEIVQASYGLFEYVINGNGQRVPKLYRVPFRVPDWEVKDILRWNYSNALTLWQAGYSATQKFIEARKEGGEQFEKYRYYPSVKDKPRLKDLLEVLAKLLKPYDAGGLL